MCSGPESILFYIPHLYYEYGEYSMDYYESHITLLGIWIMLCGTPTLLNGCFTPTFFQ